MAGSIDDRGQLHARLVGRDPDTLSPAPDPASRRRGRDKRRGARLHLLLRAGASPEPRSADATRRRLHVGMSVHPPRNPPVNSCSPAFSSWHASCTKGRRGCGTSEPSDRTEMRRKTYSSDSRGTGRSHLRFLRCESAAGNRRVRPPTRHRPASLLRLRRHRRRLARRQRVASTTRRRRSSTPSARTRSPRGLPTARRSSPWLSTARWRSTRELRAEGSAS